MSCLLYPSAGINLGQALLLKGEFWGGSLNKEKDKAVTHLILLFILKI